jgi:hypothetical protein
MSSAVEIQQISKIAFFASESPKHGYARLASNMLALSTNRQAIGLNLRIRSYNN